GIGGAHRGPQLVEGAEPGAAANNARRAIAAAQPGRSIARRARIVGVTAVLGALPDIAEHIVKAEAIRAKRSDRRSVEPSVAAGCERGAALLRTVVGELSGVAVSPRHCTARSCTRGIFPLRLRRQAIGVSSLRRQPFCISLGVAPADTDDGIPVRLVHGLASNPGRSPVALGVPRIACFTGEDGELSAGDVV